MTKNPVQLGGRRSRNSRNTHAALVWPAVYAQLVGGNGIGLPPEPERCGAMAVLAWYTTAIAAWENAAHYTAWALAPTGMVYSPDIT